MNCSVAYFLTDLFYLPKRLGNSSTKTTTVGRSTIWRKLSCLFIMKMLDKLAQATVAVKVTFQRNFVALDI